MNKDELAQVNQFLAYTQTFRRRRSLMRERTDLSSLDTQTYAYLQTDQHQLRTEIKRTDQSGTKKQAIRLNYRLRNYYRVKNFFTFVAQQGLSTKLTDITSEMIESFVKRDRSGSSTRMLSQDKRPKYNSKQDMDLREIKAFFNRAIKVGVVQHNPALPLVRAPSKLIPKNPSPQIQSDCQAFQSYLQTEVKNNSCSPGTAIRYYRHLLTLLHDGEQQRTRQLNWPTELDDLFSDPKWIVDWLRHLENRSISTEQRVLARVSVMIYLNSIYQIWKFLKSQGRASEQFYLDLIKQLKPGSSKKLKLPGRASRVIEALSAAEESIVFQYIKRHSSRSVLKLRDTAMFTTALQTTIRVDGLNSMCIENFKELAPGIYVCYVRVKRSSKKYEYSIDLLAEDQSEWRDWYISPQAISAIGMYLTATKRNWSSKGPVWLTVDGRPLSYQRQQDIFREWLTAADCQHKGSHVLRHTGIERLVNKYHLSLPTVQAISQHISVSILLDVYAKQRKIESFRSTNRLYPADTREHKRYQDQALSIATDLNEISAVISRYARKKRRFTRTHMKLLLRHLRQQIESTINTLKYETLSEGVVLPIEDYDQIDQILRALDTSSRKLLGYEPKVQYLTLINPLGRKPKYLLEE